jgi:hypothetical protein
MLDVILIVTVSDNKSFIAELVIERDESSLSEKVVDDGLLKVGSPSKGLTLDVIAKLNAVNEESVVEAGFNDGFESSNA